MYPAYLNLSKKELESRIEKLLKILKNCEICPRKCHVNRLEGKMGFCKLGTLPQVSAFHPHFGEESVLVGKYGSGTIFFTSCNLSCIYCQNYEISQLRIGKEISFKELALMMIRLQNLGCHNINLVSPTSHVPAIVKSLAIARDMGLNLPLVYNTNTYDAVNILKLLDGIIDIYMPDAKYSDDRLALKYSDALYPPKFCKTKLGRAGYFEIMKQALKEMHKQVGDLVVSKEGIAVKGLLVRQLVLPNNIAGSQKIFEFLAKQISQNTFLNIMDQYWPCHKAKDFPELNRPITKEEYSQAIQLALKAGLKRFYREQYGMFK